MESQQLPEDVDFFNLSTEVPLLVEDEGRPGKKKGSVASGSTNVGERVDRIISSAKRSVSGGPEPKASAKSRAKDQPVPEVRFPQKAPPQEVDAETERKRELLKEFAELARKNKITSARALSLKNDIWEIEDAIKELRETVAVSKGHQMLKEGIFSVAAVAEEASLQGQIPLALHHPTDKRYGLVGALGAQESKIDRIVADLCVKYAYLFKDISPEAQLVFLLATTVTTVHYANKGNNPLAATVRGAEAARSKESVVLSTQAFNQL
jgi:hypothetical protein